VAFAQRSAARGAMLGSAAGWLAMLISLALTATNGMGRSLAELAAVSCEAVASLALIDGLRRAGVVADDPKFARAFPRTAVLFGVLLAVDVLLKFIVPVIAGATPSPLLFVPTFFLHVAAKLSFVSAVGRGATVFAARAANLAAGGVPTAAAADSASDD
jgi:hypothetical protein